MSDSQRPKVPAPAFEIPDLDLAPAPRSAPRAAEVTSPSNPRPMADRGYSAPNLFDDDALTGNAVSFDLDHGGGGNYGQSFDYGGDFELEPVLSPTSGGSAPGARPAVEPASAPASAPAHGAREPTSARAEPDAIEVARIADYGEAPTSPHLTPLYALRVFSRQRELKQDLARLSAESQRAERERTTALAELTRAVRPQLEAIDQFRRLLSPLAELEQAASQRGQALSSINAEAEAQTRKLEDERALLETRVHVERDQLAQAERVYAEYSANAKRAEAKLKRVEIEIRNVMSSAEQKLGPKGGAIPEPEAAQLAELRARAGGIQPEVSAAQQALRMAKNALDQQTASLDALSAGERQLSRKKQAIHDAHHQERKARSKGLDDVTAKADGALAEIGRSVLTAHASLQIPEPLLAGARAANERADEAARRAELQRRAIDSFDRKRAGQGVRLTLTVAGILVLLCVLKLLF